MARPLLIRIAGCLLIALAVMSRWATAPLTSLPGYANVDLWDTVTLRGMLAHLPTGGEDAVFFPWGYPVLQLTPNLLDHLSGMPLAWLLPFPLSDSLWWLLVLTLNGLAAHRLGRRLGGSEGAGWLAAVAFVLSEPVVREANLSHAPQTMVFWAPLFVVALLDLRDAPSHRRAVAAGALLALGSLSYWYLGLFLGLGCLPLLVGLPVRSSAMLGTVTSVICAPFLAPYLVGWGDIPLTAGAEAPPAMDLPQGLASLGNKAAFVAWHGTDLAFPVRRAPADISNRVSLVLIVAAFMGRRGGRSFWWMVGLGSVMVLGPVLQWSGQIIEAAGRPIPLPFSWLAALHPVLERLTWPERWGVLISLGLAALAARAPRPYLFAGLVAVESFLVSHNLPLQSTDLRYRMCHAQLADRDGGAILELPLKRPGLQAQRPGVHRRMHRRSVINAILLPPGARPPDGWEQYVDQQPLLAAIGALEEGRWPDEPGAAAVDDLRAQGVAAIVLDTDPGAVQTRGGLNRHRAGLTRMLGEPVDLGCVLVWWLDRDAPAPQGMVDGDAWRDDAATWKAAHPPQALPTLIQPGSERGGW